MKRRSVLIFLLIVYCALLIDIMVFKYIPEIHIGHLRLRFGGTQVGAPNFIPFKSIFDYSRGRHGSLIGLINLGGNIFLLVPVGLLAFLVYGSMTWKNALMVGLAAGLAIEGMQALFQVGIFDVDDVILNALGVLLGYWIATIFMKRKTALQVGNG